MQVDAQDVWVVVQDVLDVWAQNDLRRYMRMDFLVNKLSESEEDASVLCSCTGCNGCMGTCQGCSGCTGSK